MIPHGHARPHLPQADPAPGAPTGRGKVRLFVRARTAECATEGCGTLLAAYHVNRGELYCSCCQKRFRSYNPAHDPRFADRLRRLFEAHPGEPINPRLLLGIAPEYRICVRDTIQKRLRRTLKMDIRGSYTGTWLYVPQTVVAATPRAS